MKKRTFYIVAVAITAFVVSLNAFAQPPGGGRGQGGGMGGPGMGPGGGMGMGQGPGGFGGGMGGGMMMGGPGGGMGGMLQNPELTKLLELSPEQTNSLQRVFTEARTEIQEQMRTRMQAGGPPPNPNEMRQEMEKFMDGIQVKTDQILRPEQRTKAREVGFQLTGGLESPMLAMNTRTLDVLNLTTDQKENIRATLAKRTEESMALMEEMRQDPNFDFRNPETQAKIRAANEELSKKYADQIKVLLTAEQRATAERLTAAAPALREKLGIPAPGQ